MVAIDLVDCMNDPLAPLSTRSSGALDTPFEQLVLALAANTAIAGYPVMVDELVDGLRVLYSEAPQDSPGRGVAKEFLWLFQPHRERRDMIRKALDGYVTRFGFLKKDADGAYGLTPEGVIASLAPDSPYRLRRFVPDDLAVNLQFLGVSPTRFDKEDQSLPVYNPAFVRGYRPLEMMRH
jgi:hypothetical protein